MKRSLITTLQCYFQNMKKKISECRTIDSTINTINACMVQNGTQYTIYDIPSKVMYPKNRNPLANYKFLTKGIAPES